MNQISLTPTTNFIKNIINNDIHKKTGNSHFATRFPPEPNGHLHLGHVKSICLNFGLAKEYSGVCHLRFDDTNPENESHEYVEAIIEAIRWLGFSWEKNGINHLYYASDYFDQLYKFAKILITRNKAYVDSQNIDEIKKNRGTLNQPGQVSPFRDRTIKENLELFERMRAGEFNDGDHVLRLKIDMASPNINMRDPIIYRIRHVSHHRTKNKWCIYPLYDYAHCISDALENITHSLCTLEFEAHRSLYEWILEELAQAKAISLPLPKQIEFSRLNITHALTSKRKLLELINSKYVDGWDDPRLMTIIGLRRRGYTPTSLQLFCQRLGISKADSLIDISLLEQALRDDLDPIAPRLMAVLSPLKLVIDNLPKDKIISCTALVHPNNPSLGIRQLHFTRELWVESSDFYEIPPKGFFRLFPGNRVRLRHGFVVECIRCEKDNHGKITHVHCKYFPDSQSGTEGANKYKVKGNIHWVSSYDANPMEIRLFDRLFLDKEPTSHINNFDNTLINPNSKKILTALIEPSALLLKPEDRIQIERHGYFIADRVDSTPNKPILNLSVLLKDSWNKK